MQQPVAPSVELPVRFAPSPPASVAFVVGAARSGTTLLYKALCLHPEVAFISNWVARFPGVPRLAGMNRLARRYPDAARSVWFEGENAYVYGHRRPAWRRAFPQPVEGEPVYRAAGAPSAPSARSGVRSQEALRSAFRSILGHDGGSLLVSKRIANNLRIPYLAGSFPRARFVELVRDGRAVAYSLSRVDWWRDSHVWWYGGTPDGWRAEGRDPWEMCARNWVEERAEIRRGLSDVPDDLVLRLRYEDLVEEPLGTLERVATFLGLDPAPAWRDALRAVGYPDRNEAWRTALDERIIRLIERIQDGELAAEGYGA